jgi:hypothetical protein
MSFTPYPRNYRNGTIVIDNAQIGDSTTTLTNMHTSPHFDKCVEFNRTYGGYRRYWLGMIGEGNKDSTGASNDDNSFGIAVEDGSIADPTVLMELNKSGDLSIKGSVSFNDSSEQSSAFTTEHKDILSKFSLNSQNYVELENRLDIYSDGGGVKLIGTHGYVSQHDDVTGTRRFFIGTPNTGATSLELKNETDGAIIRLKTTEGNIHLDGNNTRIISTNAALKCSSSSTDKNVQNFEIEQTTNTGDKLIICNRTSSGGFNSLCQENDQAIVFTDDGNNNGSNISSGLVIGPKGHNGIRITNDEVQVSNKLVLTHDMYIDEGKYLTFGTAGSIYSDIQEGTININSGLNVSGVVNFMRSGRGTCVQGQKTIEFSPPFIIEGDVNKDHYISVVATPLYGEILTRMITLNITAITKTGFVISGNYKDGTNGASGGGIYEGQFTYIAMLRPL